jgi:hypothetical protein
MSDESRYLDTNERDSLRLDPHEIAALAKAGAL